MLNAWAFPDLYSLPYQCLLCAAGEAPQNAYMWADFEPPISNSCSVTRSIGRTNLLVDNHADIAGGAVFATDMASFNFTCSNELPSDDTIGCPSPAWSGNTVGSSQPDALQG